MDRFYRGFIAGSVGGIIMNIWSLFSYHILNFSTLRYLDWASVILYGNLPTSSIEAFYALIIQILWVSLLGVLFAYMIPITTSRGYLGKGIIFGLLAGFIIYAVPTFFKVPELEEVPFYTVVSDHLGGIFWGLTMAYVLSKLDTSTVSIKR